MKTYKQAIEGAAKSMKQLYFAGFDNYWPNEEINTIASIYDVSVEQVRKDVKVAAMSAEVDKHAV